MEARLPERGPGVDYLLCNVGRVAGREDNLLDAGPLYAGESIARIDDVRPAAELVRELSPS
jgi:hypothetical protein